MNQARIVRLLLLPAIWGASFLSMRIGAALLGTSRLISARVGLAPLALTATFLIPLCGILWGTVFLGENVGWHTSIGSLTVFTARAWVTGFSLSTVLPVRKQDAA